MNLANQAMPYFQPTTQDVVNAYLAREAAKEQQEKMHNKHQAFLAERKIILEEQRAREIARQAASDAAEDAYFSIPGNARIKDEILQQLEQDKRDKELRRRIRQEYENRIAAMPANVKTKPTPSTPLPPDHVSAAVIINSNFKVQPLRAKSEEHLLFNMLTS